MKPPFALALLVVAFAAGCAACFWPDLFIAGSREREAREAASGPLPAVSDVPAFSAAGTAEAAYAAIPHRRTVFDARQAEMPTAEREYLLVMFSALDQGIVLRVESLRRFSEDRADREECLDAARRLIVFLSRIEPPPRLAGYHRDVIDAMTSQLGFFAAWNEQGRGFVDGEGRAIERHENVRRASEALHRAYEALLKAFPGEPSHNRDAFFDYHCALDFI